MQIKRRATMLLWTAGAALLLATGVAFAAESVQCPADSSLEAPCLGDGSENVLVGTGRPDFIFGLGADDALHGEGGDDFLNGDDTISSEHDGDDAVFGGKGDDVLRGAGGSDLLSGGGGDDSIDASESSENEGADTAYGGKGNDNIFARADGKKDVIDCGEGNRDRVEFDRGIDRIENCEIQNPLEA